MPANKRKNALHPAEPEVDLSIEKNWMIIEIDYGNKIVLPVKEGTQFLSLLAEAYQLKEEYQKKEEIRPIDLKLNSRFISGENYKKFRMNYVLGVNDVEDSTD